MLRSIRRLAMNAIAFLFISIFTGLLPNVFGNPTLSESLFYDLKDDPSIFPDECQILYSELISDTESVDMHLHKLYLYGDGAVFAETFKTDDNSTEIECYYAADQDVISELADKLVKLSILEAESDCPAELHQPVGEYRGYFLSLRISDYYCSIVWSGVNREDPEWFDIVEHMRSVMDCYRIEENQIEPEDYLDIFEEYTEIYGYNVWMLDSIISEYVEDGVVF